MPNPKRKHSKQRRDKRRTHDKAVVPTLGTCQNCGAAIQYHRVCPSAVTIKGNLLLKKKLPPDVSINIHMVHYHENRYWYSGGDFAPEATVCGSILAKKVLSGDVQLVLIGDKDVILSICDREISIPRYLKLSIQPSRSTWGNTLQKLLYRSKMQVLCWVLNYLPIDRLTVSQVPEIQAPWWSERCRSSIHTRNHPTLYCYPGSTAVWKTPASSGHWS